MTLLQKIEYWARSISSGLIDERVGSHIVFYGHILHTLFYEVGNLKGENAEEFVVRLKETVGSRPSPEAPATDFVRRLAAIEFNYSNPDALYEQIYACWTPFQEFDSMAALLAECIVALFRQIRVDQLAGGEDALQRYHEFLSDLFDIAFADPIAERGKRALDQIRGEGRRA